MKKFLKTHMKLCIAVLALMVVTVGGTLALMVMSSSPLVNQFTVASVDTQINETMFGQGDKQVSIKNNGPSDAYVRARIMVSGVEEDQVEIVETEPDDTAVEENKVYLVMQNNGDTNNKWCKESGSENASYSDAFYYYLVVLQKGEKTTQLLTKVVFGSNLEKDQEFLAGFNITVYQESVLAINKPEQPNGTVDLNMVTKSFAAASATNGITP